MTARDELTSAPARRHVIGTRDEKRRILDEFLAITGFHRKHAMRLPRSGATGKAGNRRVGRRICGEAVRGALVVLWEASDRICGKHLSRRYRRSSKRWSGTAICNLDRRSAPVCRP